MTGTGIEFYLGLPGWQLALVLTGDFIQAGCLLGVVQAYCDEYKLRKGLK